MVNLFGCNLTACGDLIFRVRSRVVSRAWQIPVRRVMGPVGQIENAGAKIASFVTKGRPSALLTLEAPHLPLEQRSRWHQ